MNDTEISDELMSSRIEAAVSVLSDVSESYGPAVLAISFGAEDMVLLDMVVKHARSIEVFTLDTGRLPVETHRLMSEVRERYPVVVRVYCPDTRALEDYINRNGPDAFYNSVSQRKECCHVRKVEPLVRALEGKQAWVTGLRREQSPTREDLSIKSWDPANDLYKFSPLLDWSWDEVCSYVARNKIPYNALHDRGYPSIGCAPCTRAVEPGADARSGRWWWEDADSKECGLHRSGEQ
jgi:phosphoadenosine phosphosulfate reductase